VGEDGQGGGFEDGCWSLKNMINGTASKMILCLLSLAVGIVALVVPTLAWLRPSTLVEATVANFLSYEMPSQAGYDSFEKSAMILSGLIGGYALIRCVQLFKQIEDAYRQQKAQKRFSVEDRLDELEHLKRRDMVTPEEYAAKRAEILNDL
jgi:hypothetical protein